jgi:His/Glu/Gln/Arg/opine family amino acid ABC transporter permease subunit
LAAPRPSRQPRSIASAWGEIETRAPEHPGRRTSLSSDAASSDAASSDVTSSDVTSSSVTSSGVGQPSAPWRPARYAVGLALLGAVALTLEVTGSWRILWENRYYLGLGLLTSWLLSVAALLIGLAAGTILAAARLYAPIGPRHAAIAFIEIVRAIPDLMVIFWIYYGVPGLTGMHIDAMPAAVISLSVIASAYLAEDIRAGIISVPAIQHESAYASGLTTFQAFLFITLPQALRNMIPAVIATSVRLFKMTSVVFVVGVVDFFRAAIIVNNIENAPYQIYTIVAVVYFLCCYGISSLIRLFGPEQKFGH